MKIKNILTEPDILKFGFKKTESLGWTKYRLDNLQLVEVPTSQGKFIAFEYELNSQTKYRLLDLPALHIIYEFINNKPLVNENKLASN